MDKDRHRVGGIDDEIWSNPAPATPKNANPPIPREREWTAQRVSAPTVYHLSALIVGLVTLGIGIAHLISRSPNWSLGGAIALILFGVYAISFGGAFLFFPVYKVQAHVDGSLSFISHRRRLDVKPGELQSVRTLWLDPSRLLPYRVKATTGSTLLFPRLGDTDALKSAMLSNNRTQPSRDSAPSGSTFPDTAPTDPAFWGAPKAPQ